MQNGSVLLADLVDVLGHTASTARRADKVTELVALLRRTAIEDVESVVALAIGTHRPTHDISGWTSALADEIGPSGSSSLTIDDVRRVVEAMSIASGTQTVEAAGHSLVDLLGRATADEQAAVREMVDPSGESPISAALMSSAIAKAARVRVSDVRRAASVTSSLPMTATLAFLEGETALASVEPRAGRPIQPMRAAPADDLDEALFPTTCVEWAPSGVRLQAHRAGRAVSLFVHDGVTSIDVTDRLPAVVALVRGLPGDDLVLDGELAGSGVPAPTEVDVDRSVWFFDLLFDGDALLDRPLAQRRRALHSVVPPEHRLPSLESSDPADVQRFLRDAHAHGRDGVVLKDLASPYEPGRRGRSWRVVAPGRTLDLVVVAAEWGTGRRSDKLSRLHLGARTPSGEFETVGQTALGVTDEMLAWQTERLIQLAVDRVNPNELVVVRPEQVVEVAFESVHAARRGGEAVSLRSARVRRYRDDKQAGDSDTIETVRALVEVDERQGTQTAPASDGLRRRADDVPGSGGADAPRLPPARPPGLDAAQATAAKRIREVLADRQDAEAQPEEVEQFPAMPPPASLPVSGYLRGHIASLDLDFAPYEEPVLETGRTMQALVMLVRFTTLGWAVALTTGAFITRSEFGPVDRSLVQMIGWGGIPIVAALAISGWAWCDRLTRNLKRLDGRLPSRLRCVTAWLTPTVAVGLMALTVVRIEPTDVVDVRPSIIVGLLATVMWRPYALIRRILATLIRVRSDALLAAGYILDLVTFGMLWWRLTVWSSGADEVTRGDVEILIGICAAMSIAIASNVIVWRTIVRAGDRAEMHRAASQRTRYEHRMLRLRGVDPTDPEVWWALVQRRADEQRAEERRTEDGRAAELAAARTAAGEPAPVVVEASPTALVPTVDELVDSVRQRHSVAFRRLGAEQSDQLVGRLREQFATVVGDLAGLPLDEPGESDPEPLADDLVEQDQEPAPLSDYPVEPLVDELSEPEPVDDGPLSILKAVARSRDPLVDLVDSAAEAGAPPEADTVEADDDTPAALVDDGADVVADEDAAVDDDAPVLSPLDRLAARTAEADGRGAPKSVDLRARLEEASTAAKPIDLRARLEEAAASSSDADPVSALKRRLGLDEAVEDLKSPLEQLLGQAGTVQVEAALAEHRQQEIEDRPTERLVPPRLYALEWTRLLLVTGFAAVTAAGCWLVTETLGASAGSSDGSLGFASADVDLSRRAFIGAYSVAIALIPLWTYTVLTYARRCGMEHAKPQRHLILFALSSGACVAAFVLDGGTRGGASALLLIPGALIAGAAGYSVEPARFWFHLPSVTLTVWTVAVPGVLGVSWLGGLLRPANSVTSLQVLAFFTVTVSLVCALVTVLIALSASDIEDEIRLSPELAVPLSSTGRSRSGTQS